MILPVTPEVFFIEVYFVNFGWFSLNIPAGSNALIDIPLEIDLKNEYFIKWEFLQNSLILKNKYNFPKYFHLIP